MELELFLRVVHTPQTNCYAGENISLVFLWYWESMPPCWQQITVLQIHLGTFLFVCDLSSWKQQAAFKYNEWENCNLEQLFRTPWKISPAPENLRPRSVCQTGKDKKVKRGTENYTIFISAISSQSDGKMTQPVERDFPGEMTHPVKEILQVTGMEDCAPEGIRLGWILNQDVCVIYYCEQNHRKTEWFKTHLSAPDSPNRAEHRQWWSYCLV